MKKSGQIAQAVIGVLLVGIVFVLCILVISRLQPKQGQEVPSPTSTPTILPSQGQVDKNDPNLITQATLLVPEQYKKGIFSVPKKLSIPQGFSTSIYAGGFSEPRFFDFDSSGNMYLADKSGKIYLIKDNDKNGISDQIIMVDDNLRIPNSVDYFQGDLYSAEEDKIVVYNKINPDGTYAEKKVLISGLPAGKGHKTRTVVIGDDQKIYVSVGSSCNVCEETDARRAAIVRYNLDGSGEEIFAGGLRNSVGFAFYQNQIWSVDNGRDQIGDDIPPEEVNILTKGSNYGWPYCYGNQINNPEFPDKKDYCKTTQLPRFNMQAHSAPLGLTFSSDKTINWPGIAGPSFYSVSWIMEQNDSYRI